MIRDEIVKALIKEAGAEFADAAIAFLGDGCDHDNYLIDDRFVLRIPKTEILANHLVTEIAFLSKLSGAPLNVPQPIGPLHSTALSWPHSLYPYLPGVQGDLAERVDVGHAARSLGRMI